MSEVAFWYMRHHAPGYDIADSEADAAEQAAFMADDERGVILGVQFPDGRTIAAADWEPYQAARRRLYAEMRKRVAERTAHPRPTRRVLDPFRGQQITVEADEPDWLGRPA